MFETPGSLIIVDPPKCRLDPGGRLHAEDHPALRFQDGDEAWALEGMILKREIVLEPKKVSPFMILVDRNRTRRRVMMRRFAGLRGSEAVDAWLRAVGAEPISDPAHGDLFILRTIRGGPAFLRVRCPSTGEVHHLETPPNIRSPRAARAWTFGLHEDEFEQLVET